jgi:hypothetical protein
MKKLMMVAPWRSCRGKKEQVPPRKAQALLMVNSSPVLQGSLGLPLANKNPLPLQAAMMLISPNFPLFLFSSASASDPKRSKQRIEGEVVGHDIGTEQDVPSVTVDPLKSGAEVASEQTSPSTNLQVNAAACGAASGQILPSLGTRASSL